LCHICYACVTALSLRPACAIETCITTAGRIGSSGHHVHPHSKQCKPDPGSSPGSANQCILGDVYLRSNLSSATVQAKNSVISCGSEACLLCVAGGRQGTRGDLHCHCQHRLTAQWCASHSSRTTDEALPTLSLNTAWGIRLKKQRKDTFMFFCDQDASPELHQTVVQPQVTELAMNSQQRLCSDRWSVRLCVP